MYQRTLTLFLTIGLLTACGSRTPDQVISDANLVLASSNAHQTSQQSRASMLTIRGKAYHDKGNYTQALQDFNAAIEAYPLLGSTFKSRAETYRVLNENQKADADLAHLDCLTDLQSALPTVTACPTP